MLEVVLFLVCSFPVTFCVILCHLVYQKLNSRFDDISKIYTETYITHMTTTTNSNNRKKTGRALPCLNAEYTDPDFREHIMKTVYVRASMRDSRIIKSRSMKALGFFCFKCRKFWTNEDVDKIIQEELREKPSSTAIGFEYIKR
jgi:hypothetical protein